MVRKRATRLLVAVLLLAVASACTGKPPTPPAATLTPGPAAVTAGAGVGVLTPQDLAAQPGGLETLRIAYTLLLNKYYKPVKSNDLLQAAWDGVIKEAARQGVTDTGDAPKFTGDQNADFASFSTSFNAVAAHGDKAQYAYAATEAMAGSLHDDHTAFLRADQFKQFTGASASGSGGQVFTTRMLPDGIGYMKLSSFPSGYQKLQNGKTLEENLDDALSSFESQGVKGWVLDLRNNSGGHTESVATMAGHFIPDGLDEIDVDAAGERFQVPVDGHYFTHHHPLAVLINGGSASAAEMTAAALKDYGAARLFGTKTAGAVNGAEIFPLPGGAGLEYTVVAVLEGKTEKPLDKVGVEPDEVVRQQAGDDAPLAAAQAWLTGPGASSPPPPGTPAPAPNVLKANQIGAELRPYGAQVADVPPLPDLRQLGDLTQDTPNEYVIWAPCTTHALQLAQTAVDRGWQGQYDQFFGSGDPFTYQLAIDVYRDAAGAQKALGTNDCPQGYQAASIPVRVGDESVAMKGTKSFLGSTYLRWRRGRLVFTAYYDSEPGIESFDPLVQIAKAVDDRYQQTPFK